VTEPLHSDPATRVYDRSEVNVNGLPTIIQGRTLEGEGCSAQPSLMRAKLP